ncbi:hypothetical protein BC936DRAFT_136973, partial [Jimgerdemannia flammicorona]
MDAETHPRTSENLFNEALAEVLVPNLGKLDGSVQCDTILSSSQREYTFYDEQIRTYVHVRLPKESPGEGTEPTITLAVAETFFAQLDIHIEAAMADSATLTYNPPQQTPAGYRLPSRPNSSAPTSPRPASAQLHKRDSPKGPLENVPFYAHTYNPKTKDSEPMVFQREGSWSCLYPLMVPVVYVKTKISSPALLLTANVSYRPAPVGATNNAGSLAPDGSNEYDTDGFDTINLLEGLKDDPAFILAATATLPAQRLPTDFRSRQQRSSDFQLPQLSATSTQLLTQRRSVRRFLPVRSALNVKMRTTNVSIIDRVLMMSVELENDDAGCPFLIESLDVQVTNAVVASALAGKPGSEQLPARLKNSDQIIFLYNITLLEDGSSGKPPPPPNPPGRGQARRSQQTQSSQPQANPDTDRVGPQRVSIVVHGAPEIDGVIAPSMQSKWNTTLEITGLRNREHKEPPLPDPRLTAVYAASSQQMASISSKLSTPRPMSVPVSPGAGIRSLGSPTQLAGADAIAKKRQVMSMPPTLVRDGIHGARRAPEMEVADGIVVSFTVSTPVIVGRIFTLHIFIVNRTKHTRRFMVVVPNRKRANPDTMGTVPGGIMKTTLPPLPLTGEVEPFMEET